MGRKQTSSRHAGATEPPASGQAAGVPLVQQDIDASADELVAYLRLWAGVWPRREQREWSAVYLCGQLANLERKTIEPMMLALKGPDLNALRGLQQFMSQSPWRLRPVRERLQQLVGGWLGDRQAVLTRTCGSGRCLRWQRLSQAGHAFGWRGASVLRCAGQDRQLPARCVCRLCQRARLCLCGWPPVCARALVRS